MKIAVAGLMLCALTQSALAKEPDCRSIDNASGRLACYDAASPPKAAKPAAVESDASRPAFIRPDHRGRRPNVGQAEEYLPRLLKAASRG